MHQQVSLSDSASLPLGPICMHGGKYNTTACHSELQTSVLAISQSRPPLWKSSLTRTCR